MVISTRPRSSSPTLATSPSLQHGSSLAPSSTTLEPSRKRRKGVQALESKSDKNVAEVEHRLQVVEGKRRSTRIQAQTLAIRKVKEEEEVTNDKEKIPRGRRKFITREVEEVIKVEEEEKRELGKVKKTVKKQVKRKAKKTVAVLDTRGQDNGESWDATHAEKAQEQLRKAGFGPLLDKHGLPPFVVNAQTTANLSAYEALVRAIVYQQLAGSAAFAILQRFLKHFGSTGYPTPQQVIKKTPEDLRTLGLSMAKARSIIDLSEKFADGTLDEKKLKTMNNEDIADNLIKVRGIGPWSVDMFLLFHLGRLDILPVGDLGVKRGMKIFYSLSSLPDAAEMVSLSSSWKPYRSLGSWLMWRATETKTPADAADVGGK